MEIYTNSADRQVSLTTPVTPTGPVDVTVYDGTTLALTTTATLESGDYVVDLPFSLVNAPKTLRVHWHFNYVESTTHAYDTDTYVDIVVPLVSINQAREELVLDNTISDEQIILTERRVRRIIERITGQVFAPVPATLQATQLPNGDLRLPQRLITTVAVGGVQNDLYYVLANSGWRLAISYPRKRDGIRAGGPYLSDVPISDPFAQFRAPSVSYVAVTGVWGYEYVPTDIQEAALILMEQQLCPESLYQERYIKTMTAADMRFEFDPQAYAGTGNVIVDQILHKYTPSVMAVI